MKKLLFSITFFFCLQAFAQQNKYWIKFKDKNNNAFSLANPQQFLSQQSIERRTKQNIALNESDLPITKSYEDGIAPFVSRLVHRLKWFNIVVVEINDSVQIDAIRQ